MQSGLHVVVSGGSRGLGAAFTEALLSGGYAVSTFSRKPTPFIEGLLAGEFRDRFHFSEADMTDSAALARFTREAFERFGVPWALINNAGVARDNVHPLETDRAIREIIDINLTGALVLTKLCSRAMLTLRRGRIVSISSIVGLRGYRGLATYSATKAGLDGMTRALARELGSAGITVNAIAPGYMETELSSTLDERNRRQIIGRTPLGRLGQVQDCVPLLLFLLSDAAAFITGQTLVVDGGITC
jgi:3-oxoacyl-[acyl-carrier protein] reductase